PSLAGPARSRRSPRRTRRRPRPLPRSARRPRRLAPIEPRRRGYHPDRSAPAHGPPAAGTKAGRKTVAGTEPRAEQLADIASRAGLQIAVAESLTAGNLAAALGAAPNAGEWFRGGVVAYSRHVKHHVLDVPPGPVVCEDAAEAMAAGVKKMMDATLTVAVT